MKVKLNDKVIIDEKSPFKYQQCGIGIVNFVDLKDDFCTVTWEDGSIFGYSNGVDCPLHLVSYKISKNKLSLVGSLRQQIVKIVKSELPPELIIKLAEMMALDVPDPLKPRKKKSAPKKKKEVDKNA